MVSWNGAHLLPECLASLRAQTAADALEIVVVDNASTDGTAELLARDHPEVRVVRSPRNVGFAGGVALGTRDCTRDQILLLNNDATLAPDALERLSDGLDVPGGRVGAVTAKILLAGWYKEADEGEVDAPAGRSFRRGDTLLVPCGPEEPGARRLVNSTGNVVTPDGAGADRDWLADDGTESTDPDVFGFCGGAALLRRDALESVGGFDADLFLYYEDTDVSWKLRAAGWEIRYVAGAVAEHRHAASSDATSPLFRYYNTRNSVIVAWRHAPWAVVARATARQTAGLLLAAARRSEPTPVLNARARGLLDAARRVPGERHRRRARRGRGRDRTGNGVDGPAPGDLVPLFVTRKFPPSVGGMETLAADVWAALGHPSGAAAARLVAHGGPNTGLPLFAVRAAVRTARLTRSGAVDVVLVGDVLLGALLTPLLRALGVRYAVMAMGRDVVWSFPGYRRFARATLRRAGAVVAISSATAAAVREVADVEAHVVRLGVELPEVRDPATARAALRERFALRDEDVVVVILGRLVPRKGATWFVEHVVPQLPTGVRLLVAGGGQDAPRLARAVADHDLGARVTLLGAVDDDLRDLLMGGADVFVQPNVRVAGDMEGFGLVAVEAAVRGALVVASDLEGLRDAVVDGVTGHLVPAEDVAAWVATLEAVVADVPGTRARAARHSAAARELFSREVMGAALRDVLAALAAGGHGTRRRAARQRTVR